MSRAWMPLYWGDYLKDTQDLTTLQHGAYLLLIAHYWQNGELPTSDSHLSVIVKLGLAKWRSIKGPIENKFQNGWKHRRIDDEIAKAEGKRLQRAMYGSRGGTAAAIARAKAIAKAQANGPANEQQKLKQKRTNHNHIDTTTSFLSPREEEKQDGSLATALDDSALREPEENKQEAASGEAPKRPDQTSRSELEALYAKRRATA